MVELASQPGACVAQIAREHGVNDNVIFKYLTLSELKSSVFAITQTLGRDVPVEEQLRQLTQQKNEIGIRMTTEQHLQQLMNRYALLTHADTGVGK